MLGWAMSFIALIAALVVAASQSTTPAASLGVYRGAGAPAQVAAFERWNGGRPVTFALDFLAADGGWDAIAHPDWWASRWAGTGYRIVYSVPLLPEGEGTLRKGADGAYDAV